MRRNLTVILFTGLFMLPNSFKDFQHIDIPLTHGFKLRMYSGDFGAVTATNDGMVLNQGFMLMYSLKL